MTYLLIWLYGVAVVLSACYAKDNLPVGWLALFWPITLPGVLLSNFFRR